MRLVVRAWAWLCANTDDLDEKRRCLEAILELAPDLEETRMALESWYGTKLARSPSNGWVSA